MTDEQYQFEQDVRQESISNIMDEAEEKAKAAGFDSLDDYLEAEDVSREDFYSFNR